MDGYRQGWGIKGKKGEDRDREFGVWVARCGNMTQCRKKGAPKKSRIEEMEMEKRDDMERDGRKKRSQIKGGAVCIIFGYGCRSGPPLFGG